MFKSIPTLIVFLAVCLGIAAEAKPTTRTNRSAAETEYTVSYAKSYFLAKNGYEQLVRVNFMFDPQVKAIIPENKLRWIANLADFSCKLRAKNQLSYVPFRMFIYGGDDGALGSVNVAIEWLGKNAYGAEGKENCFFKLKSDFTPYDAIRGF